MVLGPAAGSALSALGGWGPPMGAAALALLDLAGAFFFMPETRKKDEPISARPGEPKKGALREAFGDRRILIVLGLYFLMFLAMTNLQVALALLAKERFGWGEKETGVGFAVFGAIGLVVQGLLIGRIVRTFKPINVAIAGGLLMALGLGLIAQSATVVVLMAGLCLMALGMGMNGPVLSTMASTFAGERRRGTILGFAQSSGGLARTLGPMWAGFLFTSGGSGAPFMSGVAATVLFSLLAFTLRRE
jgi:predicted MFS family arabinose efflux permease